MSRDVLPLDAIHPSIQSKVTDYHKDTLAQVQDALANHDIVVVGMKQNPFCKRARKALQGKNPFHYLEYGSYLGEWKPRLRLKMWAGWPTFPMVFVKGTLIGGAQELEAMLEDGSLDAMLAG